MAADGRSAEPATTTPPGRDNPAFCIYPWIHLYAGQRGDWRLCCYQDSAANPPVGLAWKQSLGDVWNGERLRGTRLRMLGGERIDSCRFCYMMEDIGIHSPRERANEDWKDHLWKVADTGADGSTPHEAVFFDIRFSNLCNFRCRMCDHTVSSSWFGEAARLGKPVTTRVIDHWTHDESFWADFTARIAPVVEAVYFAGGEPLLMEGHRRMLEVLLAAGRTDTRLTYTTNLSVLPPRVLELWQRFDDVSILASIDGVGEVGPYVRKGFVWERWLGNALQIRPLLHQFATTIMIYNVFHFPVLYRELKQRFPEVAVAAELVHEPGLLSIQVLDRRAKAEVTDLYRRFGETADPAIRSRVPGWLRYMEQQDRSGLARQFVDYTEQLDRWRTERFCDAVPELAGWYARVRCGASSGSA